MIEINNINNTNKELLKILDEFIQQMVHTYDYNPLEYMIDKYYGIGKQCITPENEEIESLDELSMVPEKTKKL